MTLQPGQNIKPPFEADQVATFVERHYGMKVTKVKELNSYDDRNFHVRVEDGKEYVLKITNTLDSNVERLTGKRFCVRFD